MDRKSCWKIKKENIQRYNKTAKTYDLQYREEQTRKYRAAFKTLNTLKDLCILDVGSGTGLLEKTAGSKARIIGVDCSKNMLKRAKRRCGNQQVLLCADADHLPFVEQTFDKIFSFTLLQNMPDPEKTVEEMYRVAKVDSEIVMSVTKKVLTRESFLHLLDGKNLAVAKFVDDAELKDYVLVCRRYGE